MTHIECLWRIGFSSIGSRSCTIFERSSSSHTNDRSVDGNCVVPSKFALNASVKSANNNRRRRKAKHLRKKKAGESSAAGKNRISESPGREISEDELHTHLDSKINYGRGGPIGPRARARGMVKKKGGDRDDTADYISDRQREQQFFLRQLNNRPTLVLNANYLVS